LYTRYIVENSASGSFAGDYIPSGDDDIGDTRFFSIDRGQGSGAYVFDITTSARLTLAEGKILNFESVRVYTVYVIAKDVGGLTSTVAVRVELLDVNEDPVINNQYRLIGENAQVSDKVGEVLIASDPDSIAGDKLAFKISSGTCPEVDCHQMWGLDEETGQLTVTAGPSPNRVEDIDSVGRKRGCKNCLELNFVQGEWTCPAATKRKDFKCITNDWLSADDKKNMHSLVIRVTDNGSDRNSGKASLFDEAVVEVFIFPENEPPSIRDTSRHIPENSKAGVNVVGDAVLGTDDDGDELRYFITGGNLGNRFQINTVTGIISVRTEKLWGEWSLNFEERNIYQLTVKTVDIPKIGFPMSDQ